jgi:uncharacterized membrane protein
VRALILLTVIVLTIAGLTAWFSRWNKARISRKIEQVNRLRAKPRKSASERYAAGEIDVAEYERALDRELRRRRP